MPAPQAEPNDDAEPTQCATKGCVAEGKLPRCPDCEGCQCCCRCSPGEG